MAWSIFNAQQGGGDAAATAWAQALLKRIGAPVTPNNVQFVYDWEKAEGGGGKYNPLNQGPVPGHPELTTTGSQYGGGAADFASWDAGLQGAADYLHMGLYSQVLNDLMTGNAAPQTTAAALWQSPWAASHYGYGSHWPNVQPGSGGSVPAQLGGAGAQIGAPQQPGVATLASSTSQPSGIDLNPFDWVNALIDGIRTGLENAIVRILLAILGAVLLVVGLVVIAKASGHDLPSVISGNTPTPEAEDDEDEGGGGAPADSDDRFEAARRGTAGTRELGEPGVRSVSASKGMAGEAEGAAEALA